MAEGALRGMRRKRGVPLRAVARELGVDPSFLSRVERGLVTAPNYIMQAYQKRFGGVDVASPRPATPILHEGPTAYRVAQSTLPLDIPLTQISLKDLLPRSPMTRKLQDIPPLFYLSPNPHLADFVDVSKPTKSVAHPYSADISAGKNTYVYDAHTYHTKVPPQGIGLLIDYYTNPGDVVLDPFCGSGMTGCAAVERGRRAILCDLSPSAAFIAYNLTTPVDPGSYLEAVRGILQSASVLEHELYATHCRICGRSTPALYMVWSYGMLCKYCGEEFILWDVARDEGRTPRESKIKTEFDCPRCGRHLKKRELKKTRRYPVQVGYKCCQRGLKEATAPPDGHDFELLRAIPREAIPQDLWYPTDPFPEGVNTRQPIAAAIKSVDKGYTPRGLWAMAYLWDLACRWPDAEIRPKLLFTLTSLYKRVTVFSEFRFWGGSGNTANLNVPAIMNEQNVFKAFERKASTISWYFGDAPQVPRELRISTQSACHLPQLPDKSVDYVFTDPPFGRNINYSEMNFLWESWLGVHTDNSEEAIISAPQGKGIEEYEKLLTQAFSEIRRVLKDAGWMTVMFHNSSAQVWNALQRAVTEAGFSVQGTQTFDKRHRTFKQFVSRNAVGYNLVLHCTKSGSRRTPGRKARAEARQRAVAFVRRALERSADEYVFHYLHVAREDEFDYRRLYAKWLTQTLPQMFVSLSFAEFRDIVEQIIEESGDKRWRD